MGRAESSARDEVEEVSTSWMESVAMSTAGECHQN